MRGMLIGWLAGIMLCVAPSLFASSGVNVQACGIGTLTTSPTILSPTDGNLKTVTLTYTRDSAGAITLIIEAITSSCDTGENGDIFFDKNGTTQATPPAVAHAELRAENCDGTRSYKLAVICDGRPAVDVFVTVP